PTVFRSPAPFGTFNINLWPPAAAISPARLASYRPQPLPLASSYDPTAFESRLYAQWEASGVFAPTGKGEPYSILLPPPNVTGTLDRKSTRLNSSHVKISYAVLCLKKIIK